MRNRTRSREYALQLLYQSENNKSDEDSWMREFWEQLESELKTKPIEVEVREYAELLVRGVLENISKIDVDIESVADNWVVERMAVVDRNILRLSTYEMLYEDDVPDKVSINEAIELAKKYGDVESPRFVNGILDQVAKKHH